MNLLFGIYANRHVGGPILQLEPLLGVNNEGLNSYMGISQLTQNLNYVDFVGESLACPIYLYGSIGTTAADESRWKEVDEKFYDVVAAALLELVHCLPFIIRVQVV